MSLLSEPDAPAPDGGAARLASYAAALAMVAVATVLAIMAQQEVTVPNLSLVFVLPVVIAAVSFGWGPALTAAAAGAFAYNFFLLPPVRTFMVADPANVWGLGLLLVVAAITSAVAAQARRRAIEAQRAAADAVALQTLARDLVAAADAAAVADACARALHRLFDAPAVVLVESGGALQLAAGASDLAEADRDAAAWALASGSPTRGGAYPADVSYDFWPVRSTLRQGAVVGVGIGRAAPGGPETTERLVEVVAAYLAVALDREANGRELLEARVEAAGERLKADLLAAVSHDLRTPLSTVLFTLQSLQRFPAEHDAQARGELLGLAETETRRLSGFVENLLDMNRLKDGAIAPRLEAAAPADLVAAALDQAAPALVGRRVENGVSAEARPLMVDAGLFESALAKVLENAGKYAPPGAAVQVRGGWNDAMGWIEVADEGPGFPGPTEPLFEKFVRGAPGDGRAPGLGLGLSLARGFLAAMGGRVEAANNEGGTGARVRLSAPLAETRA